MIQTGLWLARRRVVSLALAVASTPVFGAGVITFNEIMYHPANDAQELEFVEIYNLLSYGLDLSLWELDGGIEYTFPVGTTIPAAGTLVIAKSPAALEAAAGISGVLGPYSGQLANGGEAIRLENNSGRIMDEVDYGDGGPWPVAPDGSGASLAKIDPFTASASAANWHAGVVGGTPGSDNFRGGGGGTIVETTLVSRAADWKYRDLGTDPGPDWMQPFPTYNDGGWDSGPSPLGYGDSWITTTVSYGPDAGNKYPTTYFRHHFHVEDPADFSGMRFSAMMDDGAMLYLNGMEIDRIRMDGDPITYLDFSNDARSGGEENVYETVALSTSLLREGDNVLAAEVHQYTAGSSDLAFSVELIGQETLAPPSSHEDLLDPPDLVINEMAGVTNVPWWIELKNESGSSLDPAGYVVSVAGDPAREYTLPGSSLASGAFLQLTQAQLGFTAVDEEAVFLYRPDGQSVADARVAKRSLRGRYDDQWLHPSTPTPGAANIFSLNTDIMINEIMYHHQAANDGVSFTESDEEWIELYNRGTGTVDLTDWSFTDGIGYDFPPGTLLARGAYLVVSNFSGTLANGGERVLLEDAVGNPADEVRYYDGGRWPEFADGRGSSLELRDPSADNSVPEAWAASDEGPHSGWQAYSYEVVAGASSAGPDSQWKDFWLGLLDAGEVLLDDISVIEDPGGADTELISTRDFESGMGDWRITGNHRHSEVIVDPDDAGNQVLRLVTKGGMEHLDNHAEITLAGGQSVENGKTYRIEFRAKWVGGSRLLNTRLYFNRTPKTHLLQVPVNNGTPGARNSVYAGNIGPTIEGMLHNPPVPNASAPVTVSARIDDPDGVASATLWYSDDGGSWQQTAMTDSGEGRYAGTIPGQSASSLVQFYVEAEDGLAAASTFPAAGPDSGALYRVNDGLSDSRLHNFRIILTQANANWMESGYNFMSNDPVPATVIFRDQDIYYDVGVRFKGSLAGRHAEGKAGFRVGFNADQLFNGVLDNASVDRSALNPMARLPETLIHLAMNRAGGMMSKYSDMINVVIPMPSNHNGPAQLQLGHYSDAFLDAQFDNGGDGDLFEFEYIYYPTSELSGGYKNYGSSGSNTRPAMQDWGSDKESYRNTYLIKNNRAKDDYSALIGLAQVMASSGSAFDNRIDTVADVDQWLRYFAYGAATALSDNFVFGSNHNAYFYRRPSDGRFLYFTHDLDHKPGTPRLIPGNAYFQKMIAADPGWERLYYSHMRDILETAWNQTYMQTYTDQFSTLHPGGTWGTFLSRIGTIYSTISSELAGSVAPAYPFAVTSGSQTVPTLSATVSGDGWIDVHSVYLDGQDTPLPLTWTASGSGSSRTYAWSATVPLDPGVNTLTFLAYDYRGNLVGSNTVTVTSTATGDPLQDHLRITEMMPDPPGGSDYEFIELCNTDTGALDLSGVHFSDGIDFDFSAAGFTSLDPGAYCVVVGDLAAFTSRYGTAGITIAGEFTGKLANEGETLEILGALNEEILRFTYGSGRGWPLAAEGAGHALVPLDSAIDGQRDSSLYYGGNWRAGNLIGGSPGQGETARQPTLLLNEIVAHTDFSHPSYPEYDSNDKIELYNTQGTSLVVGADWYLSDDADELDGWAIPATNTFAAYGHVAFDEVTGFHSPITNGFGLDKAGEQVFLSYLPSSGGQYVADEVRFKGQENGVSLGRYEDGAASWYALAPMVNTTNAKPELHAVVSEIMFHPPDSPTNNTLHEYIEIHNPTDAPVDLWNASGSWRIDGGIGYVFPSNTTLAAGGSLVLVTFDPADSSLLASFLAAYGLATGEVAVLGPLSDVLDNRGERVALERPQAGDFPGDPISWVIVDEAIYFQQSPWPAGADGTGRSLQRKSTRWSGNDPESWYASFTPSPGKIAETYGMLEVPDWWLAEKIPGATNDFAAAAADDPDLDDLTTEEEYIAGTDPMLSGSRPCLESAGGEVVFSAIEAGHEYNGLTRWYSLELSDDLSSGMFSPIPGLPEVAGDGGTHTVPMPTDGYDAAVYRLEMDLR